MGRALIVVATDADRARAAAWCQKAPRGTRIDFKGPRRTLDQNARMWAALTDVAEQATHNGKRYSTKAWKVLFMHACGHEVQFLPSLDGSSFVPWNDSSSDLSKAEMSELIDFIQCWCAENGVVLHDEAVAA
jgi:hypothetical protein